MLMDFIDYNLPGAPNVICCSQNSQWLIPAVQFAIFTKP